VHEVDAASSRRLRERPDRVGVPPSGELRIPRAAVDVGPGRGVDDGLRTVAVQQRLDGPRRVEIEGRASPGDRATGTGEWRVSEHRQQRPTEPAACAGDGDTHQPADRNRDPYWRS
jgi:hypothetical protein